MTPRPRAALAAALLLVVLTACSWRSDAPGEGQEHLGDAVGAGETSSVLRTEEWGFVDGMVSVVVRNDDVRTLRRAQAVLTAVDEHGTALASSAAQARDGDCCAIVDLPPSATYGLYFDTGVDPDRIAEVVVRYGGLSWGSATVPGPVVVARPHGLQREGRTTVLPVDVTARGAAVDVATVQAVLVGAAGELVAVVSGRWRCFEADRTHRIEMELFHPVPEGTRVRSVAVLPIVSPNPVDAYAADAESACAVAGPSAGTP